MATLELNRPKQASLRRAISVAYYALFHLICEEASKVLVRGLPNSDDLQARTSRTLDHGTMARACRAFTSGAMPSGLQFLQPINTDLRLLAGTFAKMREQRHRADYDTQAKFTHSNTLLLIDQIEEAFDAYTRGAESDAATYFLFAMFFPRSDRWRE